MIEDTANGDAERSRSPHAAVNRMNFSDWQEVQDPIRIPDLARGRTRQAQDGNRDPGTPRMHLYVNPARFISRTAALQYSS